MDIGKLKKIESINYLDDLNHDLYPTKSIARDIFEHEEKRLKELVIEGLSKKGYNFENDTELHSFIKSNCSVLTHHDGLTKTFTVNSAPFLTIQEPDYRVNIVDHVIKNTKVTCNSILFYYGFN